MRAGVKLTAIALVAFVTMIGGPVTSSGATLEDLRHRAELRDRDRVYQLAEELLAKSPPVAEAYYWRGRERLRNGQFQEALSDFDRFAEAFPAARASMWERGIACYYAEQFEQGARQFSDYQTHDDNDVENAVWHLLCQARVTNWNDARKKALRVRPDPRVPMAEILRLYTGELKPQEVLDAARESDSEPLRNQQLFYAHLYIGLYLETQQDAAGAKEHLRLAADRYRIDHFMGDLAKMHADRLGTLSGK